MTTNEFSDEFDVLLNSITSGELKFDEYEKSEFLTKAQEAVVLSYYNGKNLSKDSFEKTEEIRRYLSNLIVTYETSTKLTGLKGLSPHSIFFQIPSDVWFITYEWGIYDDTRLGCMNGDEAIIVPTSQDEYYKTGENPFKWPSKRRVLRLDIHNDKIELIPDNYNISKYSIRYLKKPNPIVLVDLPEHLSINGVQTITECELSPVIHRAILDQALEYALSARKK